MGDAIDREALLADLEAWHDSGELTFDEQCIVSVIAERVRRFPAARRTGSIKDLERRIEKAILDGCSFLESDAAIAASVALEYLGFTGLAWEEEPLTAQQVEVAKAANKGGSSCA